MMIFVYSDDSVQSANDIALSTHTYALQITAMMLQQIKQVVGIGA